MSDLIDKQSVVDIAMCYCPDDDGSCSKADADIRELLDEIENLQAVNRWISVEDALPEDRQRVLICSKSKRLFDVVFRANAKMPSFDTKIFGKVYAWYCEDVIKWMPLSEQPEMG